MKKKSVKLKGLLYSFLFLFFFSTNIFSQANNYNCCITNFIRTSTTQMQFDVVIEWTGTNTQKLAFFQGGVNFNYAGIANGGTITGAFKPGSADPSLPGSQQSPTWNINQSSKQIRFFASIVSSSIAVPIASPPGSRLGTFIMTNTVPFTASSSPNFVWSFSTGTSSTTKTQVSIYVNGATSATVVTIPPNHCVVSTFCGVPCSFANAGGPYSSCGDIHLNGSFGFAPSAIWSTSGSGTFDPNNTSLNATYHPSNSDLLSGVTLTLTTVESPGPCSCGPSSNSTQINFTSIDDGDPCTIDGCDQSTGLPTHSVQNCTVTLNSSIFIQGFYTGSGMMDNNGDGGCLFVSGIPGTSPTDADTVKISAMLPVPPYTEVDFKKAVLQTDGNVSVTFDSDVIAGNSYYIRVNHRNSLETWSTNPVLFSPITNYSFSSAASQANGSNEVITSDNLYYAIYNGDINMDCAVDGTDYLELYPSILNGDGGYLPGDLNGDGAVDGSDYLFLDINIQNGVGCP